jgi:hypothetical protein
MGDQDMAAKKKTATRRASVKPLKANELRKLLKKARDELAELLQHEKAGRLTDRELETGLKEVEEQVQRILAFKNAFL